MPFGLKKPSKILSKRNGCHPVTSWMTAYLCIFQQHCRLLALSMRPHQTCAESLSTVTRRRGHPEAEESFFFIRTITCFGHVIRPHLLMKAAYTTDAIEGLKQPRNITELCSFLWLWSSIDLRAGRGGKTVYFSLKGRTVCTRYSFGFTVFRNQAHTVWWSRTMFLVGIFYFLTKFDVSDYAKET